jgi:hypothetical protein
MSDADISECGSITSCETGETVHKINETNDNILKNLETTLNLIHNIGSESMVDSIQKAELSEFASVSYLESSSFGSNKFKVKKEFIEKLEKIGVVIDSSYTFDDYCEFLTKYIIGRDLSDETGVINPDKFLCQLLQIEASPCTFIKLMGAARNVFI